ncbi:efflux pump antibiotic resistance protein [Xylariomycetidae sp. FL2044]|nr:efflux pump antibiotic resistance protein [Xylariomycetidae sp. FL2044]
MNAPNMHADLFMDDNEKPAPQSIAGYSEEVSDNAAKPAADDVAMQAAILEKTLVTFDGPEDPMNPQNWNRARKWRALIAMSGFVLMAPISTTIVAPSLDVIARELSIDNGVEKSMVLSIFLLGFGIGPLFISPLSEIFGRTRVLQLFNAVYIAMNTGCGFAQTKVQLIVLRFLAGLFGSASVGIGAGTIGDLFAASERGRAMAVYSLAPLMGTTFGPIIGGFLTQYSSWRWSFWVASIINSVVQLWGIFFLEETYRATIIRRKKHRLEKEGHTNLYTEYDYASKRDVAKTNMIRPFKLLATQPIVQVLALYQGYLHGNLYIIYAEYATLWTSRYHESVSIASLNYLSIGIGTTFAAEVSTHINDRIYKFLSDRNHGDGRPEFRIPIMVPATILLAVGLFWYGWSAQAHVQWIMPNIGIAIFTAGVYACSISNNTYIIDTYGRYSASGLASVSIFKYLAGFAFPLFSPSIYDALEYGWTNSIFGCIALSIGCPAVLLLWRYGKTLRKKSPYCANEE